MPNALDRLFAWTREKLTPTGTFSSRATRTTFYPAPIAHDALNVGGYVSLLNRRRLRDRPETLGALVRHEDAHTLLRRAGTAATKEMAAVPIPPEITRDLDARGYPRDPTNWLTGLFGPVRRGEEALAFSLAEPDPLREMGVFHDTRELFVADALKRLKDKGHNVDPFVDMYFRMLNDRTRRAGSP